MSEKAFEGLEDQLAVERRKVDVATVNFSVREVVRMFEDGELSIAPEYQRKYRWPEPVASTFIESLFLGLPIPPVFVATNADFQWEVVDGLQRISTLLMYIADKPEHLEKIGREHSLTLQGLEKLSQLNGTTYSDLPIPLQRYFGRQPIQVVSLTDKSNRSVRFDLFSRLNSGAVSLTPQEVRAAVYRGPFNDFVESLTTYPQFDRLLKLQERNQRDGTAAEQVLKFFAYKNSRLDFDGAVTKFLNRYADMSREMFDFDAERQIFEKTYAHLASAIDGPFLRTNTSITPLVQFEAVGVAIADIISAGEVPGVPPADWINDGELVDSSTGGTNTRSMLNRRVARARQLFTDGS